MLSRHGIIGLVTALTICSITSTTWSQSDFIRGDADGNGAFNGLTDGLYVLMHQFVGGPPPPCSESADADDNGIFNGLADGLYILMHQFTGGPPPNPPFPDCGPDPDPLGSLGCDSHPGCCLVEWYADQDQDTYGDPFDSIFACEAVFPYTSATGDDCDDMNPNVNPGAPDLCNGIDDDCNPGTLDGDDDPLVGTPCDGQDLDDCPNGFRACMFGTIFCDEQIENIQEVCDGIDNDCDGDTDEGTDMQVPNGTLVCVNGALMLMCDPGFCDLDGNPDNGCEHMIVAEICDDGIDNDCDGLIDGDDPDCP